MTDHEAIVPLVAALVEGSGGGGRRTPRPPCPARARLALDASALLAGLRPGVLLDYGGRACQDEAGLAAFAAGLTRLLGAGGSAAIALARLHPPPSSGCDDGFAPAPALFLVRLPLDAGAPPPWPVEVSSATREPVWCSASAAAELGASLAAAVPAPPPTSAAFDLRADAAPPTAVAAWLCGYPAALVPAAGNSALSASAARLVALRAAPPAGLTSALAAAGWPLPPGVLADGSEPTAVDVCSFALPHPGRPPGASDAWLGEWVGRVRARAQGTGWSGVRAQTGSLGAGGLVL